MTFAERQRKQARELRHQDRVWCAAFAVRSLQDAIRTEAERQTEGKEGQSATSGARASWLAIGSHR